MAKVFTAPEESDTTIAEVNNQDNSFVSVFLAGSIEMGVAPKWQSEVIDRLVKTFEYDETLEIFNPRAKSWNADEKQDPCVGTLFNEQVTWELKYLLSSDIVIINFESLTTSPVSMFELGLVLRNPKIKKFVVCPKDYFRYGNIKLTTQYVGENFHFYESRSEDFYTDLEISIQQKMNLKN